VGGGLQRAVCLSYWLCLLLALLDCFCTEESVLTWSFRVCVCVWGIVEGLAMGLGECMCDCVGLVQG
jgi:hypothetical protein